jgi:hypothetical protein
VCCTRRSLMKTFSGATCFDKNSRATRAIPAVPWDDSS